MAAQQHGAASAPGHKPAEPAHIIRSDDEAIEIAHRLAADFAAGAAARDRDRILPYAELDRFSQSGLWAIAVPKEYGGAGLSYVTVGKVYAIISAADPSLGQIAQNHNSAVYFIRAIGTPEQRSLFLGRILAGYRLGNASSESGEDGPGLQTRIVKKGDNYVLNGRKFYATGALFSHYITVIARDEKDRMLVAVVPAGTAGLSIIDDWSSFGQRTTASGTVLIDNVTVPCNHVLPIYRVYESFPQEAVTHLTHVGIDTGIARAAVEETIRFIHQYSRSATGGSLEKSWDEPYLIAEIGNLKIRLHAAESALERAADILDVAVADPNPDNNAAATVAMSEAKVLAAEAALLATNKLFELTGARSTFEKYNLDRHWRNARAHTVHDPIRWKFHTVGNYYLNGARPSLRLFASPTKSGKEDERNG